MKLRELINKLEELSNNRERDEYEVEIFDGECGDQLEGNDISFPISKVYIDHWISSNDNREYIQIRF